MKKEYVKPLIRAEVFKMAESIAAGCEPGHGGGDWGDDHPIPFSLFSQQTEFDDENTCVECYYSFAGVATFS